MKLALYKVFINVAAVHKGGSMNQVARSFMVGRFCVGTEGTLGEPSSLGPAFAYQCDHAAFDVSFGVESRQSAGNAVTTLKHLLNTYYIGSSD